MGVGELAETEDSEGGWKMGNRSGNMDTSRQNTIGGIQTKANGRWEAVAGKWSLANGRRNMAGESLTIPAVEGRRKKFTANGSSG